MCYIGFLYLDLRMSYISICCRYSYNNFLHHHVENIILSCFESKSSVLVEHLLHDCDLVGMIMEAEKNPILSSDSSKVSDSWLCLSFFLFYLLEQWPFVMWNCSLQLVWMGATLLEWEILVTLLAYRTNLYIWVTQTLKFKHFFRFVPVYLTHKVMFFWFIF